MRVHHLHMNNVMAKYKDYAQSPLQKLQYDMGEDRWLCTLMLMQGGRNSSLKYFFRIFYQKAKFWLKSELWSKHRHTANTF